MLHARLNTTRLMCCAVIAICCSSIRAEMIYLSAERSISGAGTQAQDKIKSTKEISTFTDDLLNSGYVRDDSNLIVGSVTAWASQQSTLARDQIRGLGRGSGFGSGPGEGTGSSDLFVEFMTDQPLRFTLSGQLRIVPHSADLVLNGSTALIRLTGPAGVALEVLMDDTHPPNHLGIVDFTGGDRLSGIFPSGIYTLEAGSVGHGSNGLSRCTDFEFTLTALDPVPVPEPSALTLIGCGSLVFFAVRRRR